METKSLIERQLLCLIFVVIIIAVIIKTSQTLVSDDHNSEEKIINPYHIFGANGVYDRKYGHFSEEQRTHGLQLARHMFQFGYDSYMKYAFPADELNPIDCTGRGPDVDNPSNININDVLGDYSLTLVDCLDTLVVMQNITEFKRAVRLVIENVNFDKDSTVQVFEANIRVLGALISAHLLIVDTNKPFGDLKPGDWYSKQLLDLAHDLAARLLPAFDESKTGLPFPRVNLRNGVPTDCEWCSAHTCTAGAGSLLLEFGILSRLTGDPIYESVARRATRTLYHLRANQTGLLGNVIDVETLDWIGTMSGVGAGLDSFYEYLLKSYIMFGSTEDHKMFTELYEKIKKYSRKGRVHCNSGSGNHPLYVNVNMDGSISNLWIDSLAAAWPAIQVLAGDIEEAICSHALFYNIWRRFGVLPERFNWQRITADPSALFYPLRPELAESTYLLYQATRNPFYLHVGLHILDSLNNYTRAQCGYATVHDVNDKTLEDRMESFFLSETCKYLYLLFDRDNPLNSVKNSERYIFSTEGHLFSVDKRFRTDNRVFLNRVESVVVDRTWNGSQSSCDRIEDERYHSLPLKNQYFLQVSQALGIDE